VTLAEDGSTPAVVQVAYGTTGTGTSASFSPPAGSFVVVAASVTYDASDGTTGSSPLTCKDSLSNSYAAGPAVNASHADLAFFTYYYASAPGSITVTVTNSNKSGQDMQLAPRVLTGAATSQTGAGTGTLAASASGNIYGPLTTTTAGSWVYVAAGSWAALGTLTALSGTTTINTFYDGSSYLYMGAGRQSAATVTPGAVSVGWTYSQTAYLAQWIGLEVLPAAGGGGGTTYSSYPYGTPHPAPTEANGFVGTDTNANVGEPNALGVLPLGTPYGLA
jgi:hypothetical protein